MRIIAQIYHKQYRIFYLLIIFMVFTSDAYSQLVPDFRVNDDTTGYWNLSSALATDSKGDFVVVWEDYRRSFRPNIYGQRYTKNGNAIGANFMVNENLDTASIPDVCIFEDRYIGICWFELNSTVNYSSRIKFRIYDYLNGQPLTSQILISDSTGNYYGEPRIGDSKDGKFIIVWENYDYNIYFQLVDTLGNKIGLNQKVNDDTGKTRQRDPVVTVLPNGNFVIAWEDARPPSISGMSDIYMQMYDQNGNKIGVNERVNENLTPIDDQRTPKISSDSLGRFVIAWTDDNIMNNRLEVHMQLYNPDGTKNGSNIIVAGPSNVSALSKRSNGDMVVIYSREQGLNYIPYVKRYNANGDAIGNEYIISTGYNKMYVSDVALHGDRITTVWNDERSGNFDVYCNIRSFQNPDSTVGISQISNEVPEEFKLYQNYPNPFNPTTNIKFKVQSLKSVKLSVFDVMGREAAVLVNEKLSPGEYEYEFDGSAFGSGIYFYRFEAGEFQETRRMVLVK